MAALTAQSLLRISRQNVACLGGVYSQNRAASTGVVRDQTSNLAAYKRGKGGRSSFSGLVVTVLGASGFVGKYVVNKLGKIGSQVIVPYRTDPYHVKDLKLAGDLGQILFVPYHLQDEESLRKSMKYSNVVINLVGRDFETKNFKFHDVHMKGAERIARVAKEMGVEKLIHVSHLNATPSPPEICLKGGSQYLRSKYYGEEAVRNEFPEAIVFRPADVFGLEDRFLRYYSDPWRRAHGRMPLWKRGEETIKMPVFVSDLAEGIVNAIYEPEAVGKVYEAVGPHSYQLSEIVDYMYRIMRWDGIKRIPVTPLFKMKVAYSALMPSTPPMNLDKLSREHVSDVTHYLPTLQDLGVTLTRLEDRAPFELRVRRRFASYEERLGEFAEPEPPQVLS